MSYYDDSSNGYYDSNGNYYSGSSSGSSDPVAAIISMLLNSGAGTALGFTTIVFGAIVCFFGLKLFKCMLFFFGFCIGFAIGVALGVAADNSGVAFILGILLGVGGGYVSMFLRKVVYFLFGCSLGAIVSFALNFFILSKSSYNSEEDADNAIQTFAISTFILGLIGGIIAVYIGDLIVILTTAASGAFNITLGSVGLMKIDPTDGGMPILLLELILFVGLGIWYQLRRREEWKGALEIHNTTIVNTTVNTNVATENKIEVRIDAPQQPQYPGMYPGYSVPFIQNPYPPQPYGQPQMQPQMQPDQQYAQPPQQFSQPPQQYSQPPQQYGQPPQYAQPMQPQYAQPTQGF